MNKTSYILVGARGRMGLAIQDLQEEYSFELYKSITRDSTFLEIDSDKADICIDFSSSEACESALEWCINAGIGFLSGTTGISKDLMLRIQDAGKQIPVLYAPNTSLGVTFFRRVLLNFASIKNWDYQIIESHHSKKKDAPSGTGKLLQDQLVKVVQKEVPAILSIRGGGIFGEHKVMAMSEEEVIEIKHTALSRKLFARGALVAAKFLANQGPGFYSMDDVLDQL